MRHRKCSKAFSLIELSIVILVIGVLIGGVFSAVDQIYKFRIKAAQYLTMGSPVSSIAGLDLWFEVSLENSLSVVNPQDNQTITRWNNINPHIITILAYFLLPELIMCFIVKAAR